MVGLQDSYLTNLYKSMKKLSLKASDLHKGEVLTRKQLKNVLGGDGSGSGGSGSGGSGATKRVKCCIWGTSVPIGCDECMTYPIDSWVNCPGGHQPFPC